MSWQQEHVLKEVVHHTGDREQREKRTDMGLRQKSPWKPSL
jgi:hypothetical protein